MVKRIICFFKGCKFYHVEDLCDHAARFKCSRCGIDLAYTKNEGGMIIPYTPEVKDFYKKTFPNFYKKDITNDK
jgi:hypothetical protein